MALWLNRSGRHCEYDDKFLNDNRICLTCGVNKKAAGGLLQGRTWDKRPTAPTGGRADAAIFNHRKAVRAR